jgi:hypothetical protein
MRTVSAVLESAVVAAGVAHHQGRPASHSISVAEINGSTGVGVHQSTFDAPGASTLTAARYVITVAGSGAAATMTIQLLVNQLEACTIVIPCDGAEGTEVNGACDAPIELGQDVDWLVSASTCAVRPTGNLSFIVRAR